MIVVWVIAAVMLSAAAVITMFRLLAGPRLSPKVLKLRSAARAQMSVKWRVRAKVTVPAT